MSLSVLEHRDRLGVAPGKLLIDGSWRDGDAGTWTHVHPATNEEVTTISVASAADVDAAVAAARRAFDDGDWSRMQARDRQRVLLRIAELFTEHGREIDELQTLDNGIPVGFSAIYQLSSRIAADVFTYQAGWIDKIAGQTLPTYTGNDFFTFTLKEPVGVVAAIIPWNAPVMLFAQKLAPALAAGCAVVLKPSEFASLTSLRMAELCQEAGLPDGVLNVVTGPPDPTGEALITHPGVEKITFTGSRAVGTRMMHAASDRIARVSLELGGKSPNLIFDDIDVGAVAMGAMGMVSMGLSGQGCVCHTRALVQDTIYDDFVAAAAEFAAATTYGDPFDAATTSSALINPRQLDRVTGYIEKGQAEGATLVCGGDRPGGDLSQGNFVNPTLFAGATNQMAISTDEIFGPVLVAIPFHDEAQAVALANATNYGLGASVQTNDVKRALRVAKAVRSGSFGVNGYTVMPNAPFGGYKESGMGREGGAESIAEFLETKTVTVSLTDAGF
jgi:aldehyde dehydrogenase (NAD+)